jgi:hypothetical protein
MAGIYDISKPRYKIFYELLDETHHALKTLKIVTISQPGIKKLYGHLKESKIKIAHGSLRLDKDREGTVFLQEFRPSPSIFQRGEFYSIGSDKPFWEVVGTAIIRLSRRKSRLIKDKLVNKHHQYCIILQGGLNIQYIESLLDKGSVSYDTQQSHLCEEPVYAALSILHQVDSKQIIEIKIKDKEHPEAELTQSLFRMGKSIKNIACLIGKNRRGHFYTAPHDENTEFPKNICTHKVVPIEISKEINRVYKQLLSGQGLLILDGITFDELSTCLENRDQFYYDVAQS